MVNRAQEMLRSFVIRAKKVVFASWECRLPYRPSLLMSS